ncbi:MAG: family N-acetyltransferase [Herbinix sp.]|jgi:ribosomal-protein-alanine N-acetyltransferase|nr:family N-acetyltransferase [Herbinix sp.]
MKHIGTKIINTQRLILRPFSLEDALAMYNNWASDKEVTKFLTWPNHSNVDISKKVIQSWIEEYEKEDYYQWCIEWKESQEAIGSISVVHRNDETDTVELGYCIGRQFWNQGITSEALSAMVDFFFNEVNANRIEARHDTNNPNSGKVMMKSDFVFEGIHRKADKNNTGICDVAYYGILAEDYRKNRID